jgi:WD40 repeat protein
MIAAGFTDGNIRLFSTQSMKYVNKCKAVETRITTVKFTDNALLVSSHTGVISVVFFEEWDPLKLRIESFGMAGAGVVNFDVSSFSPRTLLLASTENGRVSIWEKKPHVRTQPHLFEDETSEFTLIDVFDMATETQDTSEAK